jgi:hypothetical protein
MFGQLGGRVKLSDLIIGLKAYRKSPFIWGLAEYYKSKLGKR